MWLHFRHKQTQNDNLNDNKRDKFEQNDSYMTTKEVIKQRQA